MHCQEGLRGSAGSWADLRQEGKPRVSRMPGSSLYPPPRAQQLTGIADQASEVHLLLIEAVQTGFRLCDHQHGV